MPETFLNKLEQKINVAYGKQGRQSLYSTGKKFGYRFALLGCFSKISDLPKNKFLDYFAIINKFIEGTYASEISPEVDFKNKIIKYKLKNFVVCSKVGPSFFLPLGAAAGLISMMFEDSTIEGLHLNCQHEGDKYCELIYAPISYLKKNFKDKEIFVEADLKNLDASREYATFNKVLPIRSSTYSFQDYLKSHLFDYHFGIITHNDQRYFILEVSAIYLLERGLAKLGADKILFDSAFETGQSVIRSLGIKSKTESIMDLLAAFGWGDILILKKEQKHIANISAFPFTKFYKDINFEIVRGLISGMVSAIEGKRTIFSKVQKTITKEGLSLALA